MGWQSPVWVMPDEYEATHGYLALYSHKGEDGDRWASPSLEVGDWAFSLDDDGTRRFVELLNGLLAEVLFEPVTFHLDGDLADLGRGGGPLEVRVELAHEGVQVDLFQLGQHTGAGATIPTGLVAEVAAAASKALNR
ncbi:hypothetical protein AB0K18_42930 [Nonomuraea sp. NPDC049421]|uniref:hypothetical protein n=1 Tax=Nonomuraea sp. NPDC049421 TaxID=3155275 RepID=UPI003415DD71